MHKLPLEHTNKLRRILHLLEALYSLHKARQYMEREAWEKDEDLDMLLRYIVRAFNLRIVRLYKYAGYRITPPIEDFTIIEMAIYHLHAVLMRDARAPGVMYQGDGEANDPYYPLPVELMDEPTFNPDTFMKDILLGCKRILRPWVKESEVKKPAPPKSKKPRKRKKASKDEPAPAAEAEGTENTEAATADTAPATAAPAKATTRKTTTKKSATKKSATPKAATSKSTSKKSTSKKTTSPKSLRKTPTSAAPTPKSPATPKPRKKLTLDEYMMDWTYVDE